MPENFERQNQEENLQEGEDVIDHDFEQEIGKIQESLKQKYGAENFPEDRIYEQMYDLKDAFGNLENIKEKRVLDLGCGSTLDEHTLKSAGLDNLKSSDLNKVRKEQLKNGTYDSFSAANSRVFEPWLCRILVELGAKPVGIDIGNLEGEEFEHYRIDLSKLGALNFLSDKSFDGVNVLRLFNSPQLELMTSDGQRKDMIIELERQIKRLLKDHGLIINGF